MISGTCLCGAVSFEVPTAPMQLTSCNCKACSKLGTLWAYYRPEDVKITGETLGYQRHDIEEQDGPMLTLHHCTICACITHWVDVSPTELRMGVNARLMPVEVVQAAHVRLFDGAVSFTFLDGPP